MELQSYVSDMEVARGFAVEDALRKGLLLAEEVGEVLKALRKLSGGGIANDSKPLDLADELADVVIVLCAIANRYEIDLEFAVRRKENANQLRFWE
jgi:NTP pyrophosphatase (non-canonical NTP hydrolase)